jgi:hypothetical protein
VDGDPQVWQEGIQWLLVGGGGALFWNIVKDYRDRRRDDAKTDDVRSQRYQGAMNDRQNWLEDRQMEMREQLEKRDVEFSDLRREKDKAIEELRDAFYAYRRMVRSYVDDLIDSMREHDIDPPDPPHDLRL